MLKFEGLLVRFSHYLLTLSSFLQRLGALNARPEGLFWNFVCTWISFVGISANLHVFFSMFFFNCHNRNCQMKRDDPILMQKAWKRTHPQITAKEVCSTLPLNQKKNQRFLRGGWGLGEFPVDHDCGEIFYWKRLMRKNLHPNPQSRFCSKSYSIYPKN